MKNRSKKKVIVTIIGILAAAVFVVTLVQALFYSSQGDLSVSRAEATSKDYPVSISIPKLNIHTHVQRVGITASGKMAVPTNFTDVGWYKYGTAPGQTGSAVIAGHIDDGLALPAVFINLDKLQPGDDIYIVTVQKQKLHFVVTGSKVYDRLATTDQIFNQKGGKYLKLITCAGDWLPTLGTHNERLVVTAVLQ